MLEYTGSGPAAAQSPLSSLLQTAAVLRIGTGLLLMTRYGISAVQNAYHFFFHETPWAWVPAFHEAGMPQAHLLAPIVAILIVGVALSWIIGFLTRLFAFVFLPVVITTLVVLHNAGSPRVEAAWLYLIITVTLLLFGSGTVSVDQLFRLGEGGSKKRR
ncbi:DoxX family protein [Prosthecobacter sp.]|uniref:DoxX family protein n=1 Tax=Prosthecobacter sp. TaxID=1965333 RepID=UPI002488F41F|nr:DoxX family protein [Prosthecobacter sp.]MDI1314090.1 DoxX family protein [Prosthecobacter sp.]